MGQGIENRDDASGVKLLDSTPAATFVQKAARRVKTFSFSAGRQPMQVRRVVALPIKLILGCV
jgi:hypothetical protein